MLQVIEPADDFVIVDCNACPNRSESIGDRITRVGEDEADLKAFYNAPGSQTRYERLAKFYADEQADLPLHDFDTYTHEDKADYILLKGYLHRAERNTRLEKQHADEVEAIIGDFASPIRSWCEKRQRVDPIEPQAMAASLHIATELVARYRQDIITNSHLPKAKASSRSKPSKVTAYRVTKTLTALQSLLIETVGFYAGYNPQFDWWVTAPHRALDSSIVDLIGVIREHVLGIRPGVDNDVVLGDPIGRDGLLTELEAELICYTPEELLQVAEREFAWCEAEMNKAAADLGSTPSPGSWKSALEQVKNMYEPPGSQPDFIKQLVREGSAYVTHHDLVTVPPLAEEGIRMYMMPAAQQKVSPFFLGGPYLQVAYPTADMAHADKLMALRGNNRAFSRATAFHEMIPGHHLQQHVCSRSGARARRRAGMFSTPFYVEGWALYWEMLLWQRGDFFVTPADRIGSLFWRMHRCVRIVFSLRFHLGELDAGQCVDMLVDRVGHERATAEGEVRRSLNGDYSPLYQAGYMLGALQILGLRREVVEGEVGSGGGSGGKGETRMSEKEFHNRILAEGELPIEMLRALILGHELSPDFQSSWRFYDL
ncbi:DUF885 family protein [Microdochium nivale]|nr:DUF885 family protein [Microdochium nivale]